MRATSTLLAAVAIMLVSANLRPAVVAVAPLVDDIRASTGWSSAITGLLTTLPVLVFGLAAPVGPRVAARFGIERTVFAALVVLIAGILIRLDPNPVALSGGSIAVGAGIGVCNVVLPALIKRDFEHRCGPMTGLYSMTLSGGAAVAAGLTVPINHAVGGHWPLALAPWAVPAGVALIVWIPSCATSTSRAAANRARSCGATRSPGRRSRDGVGYLLAAAGPVAIGGLHDATGSWTLALAVLGLALIPQAAAAMVAGRDTTMSTGQRVEPAP